MVRATDARYSPRTTVIRRTLRACLRLAASAACWLLLFAFATTLVLWRRSYSPDPAGLLSFERSPHLYEARSTQGMLTIDVTRNWPGTDMLGFSHGPIFDGTLPVIRDYAG